MMELLTTKQWFFLCCISYGLIVYFGFKLISLEKEARIDRATIAGLIVKLGAALGVDLTKDGKQ